MDSDFVNMQSLLFCIFFVVFSCNWLYWSYNGNFVKCIFKSYMASAMDSYSAHMVEQKMNHVPPHESVSIYFCFSMDHFPRFIRGGVQPSDGGAIFVLRPAFPTHSGLSRCTSESASSMHFVNYHLDHYHCSVLFRIPVPVRSMFNANAQCSGWSRTPLVVRLVFHVNVFSERFACVVISSGCCQCGTNVGGGWGRGEASERGE